MESMSASVMAMMVFKVDDKDSKDGKDEYPMEGQYEITENNSIIISFKNSTDQFKRWFIIIRNLENNDFHEKLYGFYLSILKSADIRCGGIYLELEKNVYAWPG